MGIVDCSSYQGCYYDWQSNVQGPKRQDKQSLIYEKWVSYLVCPSLVRRVSETGCRTLCCIQQMCIVSIPGREYNNTQILEDWAPNLGCNVYVEQRQNFWEIAGADSHNKHQFWLIPERGCKQPPVPSMSSGGHKLQTQGIPIQHCELGWPQLLIELGAFVAWKLYVMQLSA